MVQHFSLFFGDISRNPTGNLTEIATEFETEMNAEYGLLIK